MTREIRFRAWDKLEKRMHYNLGIIPDGVQVYDESRDFPPTLVFERGRDCFVLMQWTGLKDVYECDILEGNRVVFWSEPNAKWYARHIEESEEEVNNYGCGEYGWDLKNYVDAEVIGNTHQNPELLK